MTGTDLKKMELLLEEEDRVEMERIFSPTVVAVPPLDSRNALCVMPDGEIRAYGFRDKNSFEDYTHPVYLASRDCGLSWKRHIPKNITAGSGTPLKNGQYVSVVGSNGHESGLFGKSIGLEKGTYAILARSPDDADFQVVKIADISIADMYLPIELSNGRIGCSGQTKVDGESHPVFMWSDDHGQSWQYTVLPSVGKHTVTWPHKGLRWQNEGNEPDFVEMQDHRLCMIARTSLDYFYEYTSYDFGETWSEPVQTRFHGTLTSPRYFRLSDGRLICFHNNTQPLPELDHAAQRPPLLPGEINGEEGEDVFTNRDANHAAISEDDGKTWHGFREIALNTIRNDSDYRTKGPLFDSRDKSVHQFQAIELPMNKILLSYGQNDIARKLVIFDVEWLYEKERHEDFRCGLNGISTHVYLNSVPGNFRIAGHCAWNRTNGAVLMPDPEENFEEALFVSRIHDPRLFSETQGAVWNFPAAKKGRVTVRLWVKGEAIHLTLTDRWFNPIDETLPILGEVSFSIGRETLPDRFADLTLDWNLEIKKMTVFMDGQLLFVLPMAGNAANGISYLAIQSTYNGEDLYGAYIKKLDMYVQEE